MLRTCVHCGFCNATCPTYLLTGNELEGPRGRIYLIKGILEGKISNSGSTVEHIDNCLGCLACETTCPSGVTYSHLLEEARPRLEKEFKRPLAERLTRFLLTHLLPHPGRFRLSLRLAAQGRRFNFLVPQSMRHLLKMAPATLPAAAVLARPGKIPAQGQRRARVVLLTGCAQQVLGPQINDATVRLLTRLGAEVVIPAAMGCCGALTFHMGERRHSLQLMANNIRVWHAELQRGELDAIVLNTSGCGTAVKEYAHIFREDPELAEKARAVTALVKDVSEVVAELGLTEKLTEYQTKQVWNEAVGPTLAAQTQPVQLRNGKMEVAVPSAAWRNQLIFMKGEIINKINRSMGREVVTDLKLIHRR